MPSEDTDARGPQNHKVTQKHEAPLGSISGLQTQKIPMMNEPTSLPFTFRWILSALGSLNNRCDVKWKNNLLYTTGKRSKYQFCSRETIAASLRGKVSRLYEDPINEK